MKISSDLIRVHKDLHTWVGITAGLLLFVGFFAGALTMFKEPLDRWVHAGAEAPAAAWKAALDDRLIPELLTARPDAAGEFTVHLQPAEHRAAPISWPQRPEGEFALSPLWTAGRDAAGHLHVAPQPPSALGEMVDLLHRTGGVPGVVGDEHVGIYVMGVAAVLYTLALVSGVVVLLPTLVKDFFALRPGANRKRFWLDAHNVLGITSLPFHIVIALTAVVFAFHDQFYDALRLVVYGKQPMFSPPALQAPVDESAPLMPLSRLLMQVKQEAPGFEATELLYMRTAGPHAMVRVALAHPDAVVRGPRNGYLLLHPRSGEVLDTSALPGREGTWSAPVNAFFALHFGSYGGEPIRWTYFVLGLMGAALFYTGNLLWLESRRKRQRAGEPPREQTRAARWIAAGTVGACLGSVLGVTLALAAGKWTRGGGDDPERLYAAVYYATWLLAVAWSFWRGAPRAAISLLLACGLAALALPLLSWHAGSGLLAGLAGGHAGLSMVDITALLAAAALLGLARSTRRRALQAPPDTLWSLSRPTPAADTALA